MEGACEYERIRDDRRESDEKNKKKKKKKTKWGCERRISNEKEARPALPSLTRKSQYWALFRFPKGCPERGAFHTGDF